MLIPTIYSAVSTQIHTKQYDNIITNVGNANRINQIAKSDIPNELWEIVCGKTDFYTSKPYTKIEKIFTGIEEMKENTKSKENQQKLEVAYRACTTLQQNIQILEDQINEGISVTQNEAQLDEIRTITALFSDIMQDFILSEMESASETNASIKKASLIMTVMQIIILVFSLGVAIYGYITVSKSIENPLSDMQQLSTEISHGNLTARINVPEVEEFLLQTI